MAFLTGLLLLDAPASALNNGQADENKVGQVKKIRTPDGDLPYVSSQSFRFWLRTTRGLNEAAELPSSPVFKENDNLAYTDANPIEFWDDDVFGYMRAPSGPEGREWATPMSTKKSKAKKKGDDKASGEPEAGGEGKEDKPVLTRVSPFRAGTFVAVSPVSIVSDFGSMTRHEEGNPVLHRHQFYRAQLAGLFSLDLTCVGTFFSAKKVGFRNLDDNRIELAKQRGLAELTVRGQQAYRLPDAERMRRAAYVVEALAELQGGAKQALHYTDVLPAFVIAAVTKSGNHPFHRMFVDGAGHRPTFSPEVLKHACTTFKDDLLSSIHVGWAPGFLDGERGRFDDAVVEIGKETGGASGLRPVDHPRSVLKTLVQELMNRENTAWYN